MSAEDMANNVRKLVTSKQVFRPVSVMEGAIKELYKNAEEKLSCACLIHKDMRVIVINYFRQQKPWLIQSEVERRADILLKNSYDEYRKERNSTMNVIRRSFRKVARKQSNCGCGNNKISFVSKLSRNTSKYMELEESFDGENCNCHITCSAQYKPDNFLRPLESFVATNRSFKLKLKHLDQDKYGHLITDNPARKSTPELEENAMLSTPNKSFRVEMEDASTPTSKAPRYRWHFMAKSPMVSERTSHKSCKHEKLEACHGSTNKKYERTSDQNIVKECFKHDKIERSRGCATNKYNAKNDQTFVTKSVIEVKSREQKEKEVVVKFIHCDNHCFLCTLENDKEVDPQLVYCRNHCPKCVAKPKEDAEIVKPRSGITKVVAEKTPKKRSKSANRATEFGKKSSSFRGGSSLLNESMDRQFNKERAERSSGKENIEKLIVEDGIFVLENNVDELNVSLADYLEWDSMGVGLSPKKIESKTKIRWSNTAGVLENIKNNHLKPIKQDLKDMQNYFKVLKRKYKY